MVLLLVLLLLLVACGEEDPAFGAGPIAEVAVPGATAIVTSSVEPDFMASTEFPDALELTFIGMDTTVENGRTRFTIQIQAGPAERLEMMGDPKVVWSDGETTTELDVSGMPIQIRTAREGPPENAHPVKVTFPAFERTLAVDTEGIVYLDRIETRWGTFNMGEFVEDLDGFWFADYAGPDKRWLGEVEIDAAGMTIWGGVFSIGFDRAFNITDTQFHFEPEFGDIRADLPLPASVVVREVTEQVVVELPAAN